MYISKRNILLTFCTFCIFFSTTGTGRCYERMLRYYDLRLLYAIATVPFLAMFVHIFSTLLDACYHHLSNIKTISF